MEDNNNEIQAESRVKKSVERSAAYPGFPIEDAIAYVGEMYKHFRTSFAKREDITALIENSHPRNIAACVYYLFLNREKDTYQVSELYRTTVNPISATERRKCLLQAFAAPKLNAELIEKFDGSIVPPELIIHLSRFHKITEEAAPMAAEVFIKNAKFCGVLGDDNVLRYKETFDRLKGIISIPLSETIAQSPTDEKPLNITPTNGEVPNPAGNGQPVQKPLMLEEMVNKEEVKIRLTGNKIAYLIYPGNLTKKDVMILQKQIEQLDLMIE